MPPRKQIGRYDKLPNVKIDESRVPSKLRDLLPFARQWGILGDDALERAIRQAGRDEIRRAVKAASGLRKEIHAFAYESPGASATPIPDEVVLFQMFACSLRWLEVEAK